MILSSNPRPLQLWKTLSLEVADSGLAQVDNTWNMEKVCSPYSRVYFIPEGSGTLTLRGREIALQEGYVYLIPAGLLYNYRCDSHMEQLYFHVNIIQVNGMDLFFGCEEVYERKVSGQYLERVLALYRSQRMGGFFLPSGDSVGGAGLLYQDGRRSGNADQNLFRDGRAVFFARTKSGQR